MNEMNDYGQEPVISDLPVLPSGNDPSVLPQLTGLNWGAFLLNWIWVYPIKPLWCLYGYLIAQFIPFGGLAMAIYGLIKGNEFAWTHRPFRDVEEFRAVQAAWTKWGIIVVVAGTVISILGFVLFFSVIAAAGAAGAAGSMR